MRTKQIKIFDTTLRDGQQCPGAGMSFDENLAYAHLATKVGVDVLEAGFPSASTLDFEIVSRIAEELGSIEGAPTVTGLCQLRSQQVDKTIEALSISKNKARLHTYVPVDPGLMKASIPDLADNKPKIIELVSEYVKRAVDAGLEVEFSPEGYSRMADNFDFVTDLIRAAVGAGASVINCPDTIGGACQYQGEDYFVNQLNKHAEIIAKEFPASEVTWSVHCHNDFGLAVQNSLNGVFQGPARQIEGCFNGVGERAGNAALEQCILVIENFAKSVDADEPLHTRINTEYLSEICEFVDKHMLPTQPNWPISGLNSAKHSSGGHTNAVLKNPLAYQPFDPRKIGREITFLFGPLSGGNHAKAIIEDAGFICEDTEKAEIAQYLKDLYSERRKGITDSELIEGYKKFRSPIVIDEFDYAKSANRSEVILRGKFFEQSGEIREVHQGKDSALAALKSLVDKKFGQIRIESHKSESDGKGIAARSVSTIVISGPDSNLYTGVGIDQDIEISAMKALIDAVNNSHIEAHYRT